MEYRVVDVFAESPLAGNPLTVVLDGKLDQARRQAIARETNHSETTFIASRTPRDGAWPVRIHTPRHELPFAGHPTLGTAWVIREELGGGDEVVLDLPIGRVPVRFESDSGLTWLTAPPAHTSPGADPDVMAACLGLDSGEVEQTGIASTGLPIHIVLVSSLEACQRAQLDQRRLDREVAHSEADSVLVVTRQTVADDADLHVRYFAESHGVPEDPATGSANASLAAWLSATQFLGSKEVDCVVEQGLEMQRPSRLHLRARPGHIEVGGRVVPVARGVFL